LTELQFLQNFLNLLTARLFLDFRGGHRRLAQRISLEEEDDGAAAGAWFSIQRSYLQIDPPRGAVKADANRPAETGFIVREDLVERRADVEPQFLARKLGNVVGERAGRRLQIAASVLGQMHHAIGRVDNYARRRKAFQGFAMNACLHRRAKLGRRP
jgi:hypothetical protein